MAKNTIIMIGDGMGWEMTRAADIYKQIQSAKATNSTINGKAVTDPTLSLSDFYTSGKGTGLNMQTLTNYTISTTYATTVPVSVIDPTTGKYVPGNVYSNGQPAILGNTALPTYDATGKVINPGTVTNQTYPDIPGFVFNPTFNPGTTPTGGAKVSDGVVGNLVGYDPARGGAAPWIKPSDSAYLKYSYPDSANTATTLYTGVKTYNGAVGVDIFENPLQGILATAALQGKSTGLVTSVPIDHATPAAAAANVNNRNKYDGPTIDYILQQELRTYQPTVLLGGGHPLSFPADPLPVGVEPNTDNTYITPATYNKLVANPNNNEYGYTFLERGTDAATKLAAAATAIDPNTGGRLLGLYGARGQNGNLPVSSANGDYSTTGLDMFSVNTSKGLKQDIIRPLATDKATGKVLETDAQFIATERNQNPTLDDLTKAALNVLGKDKDGMWLMIEGGDIDWSAHDNNMDNLIGTTLDFDKSVGSVIAWINANGGWADNELIVTADHDHYLTLNDNFPAIVSRATDGTNGISSLTTDNTIAGSGQEWGNSTTDKYDWGNHSNRPVPVYYQGLESSVLTNSVGTPFTQYGVQVPGIAGFVDQTNIYQTMLASVTETAQKKLVAGSVGNDNLIATVGATGIDGVDDTIFTGAGNDKVDFTFNSNSRNNYVDAGKGDDAIFVSRNDRVFGGEGNDLFYAADGSGNNRMSGGAGDDIFYLGANDYALGGDGNDKFYVGSGGGNTISGGAGADQFWIATAQIPSEANTIVDFQIGTDVIGIAGSKSLGISASTLKLTQAGGDTNIDFGGKTLAILTGIQATSLSTSNASQFVFA
ncbi:alkaline phosphatase [Chamaesiphon sp. GL140_3_metabinner_50]|uniref:alkaline phosphatase n=1 Tax=Chamaesiphon sp. GL140_3_metabinner_50 TaxID=2970812 RepID=UPI0025D89DC3|nr:alkaline phosphatase [Chamaesiphon sp. GL140_3_metabinner_50]